MRVTLKLPRLSMNMTEATILEWMKKVGDQIVVGESLYIVETEKVTSEVQSPADGVIIEICAMPGDNIEVGDPVCKIDAIVKK